MKTGFLHFEYLVSNHALTGMSHDDTATTSNRTRTRSLAFSATLRDTRCNRSAIPQTRQYVAWHKILFESLNDRRIHQLCNYWLRLFGPASSSTMHCSAILPLLQTFSYHIIRQYQLSKLALRLSAPRLMRRER